MSDEMNGSTEITDNGISSANAENIEKIPRMRGRRRMTEEERAARAKEREERKTNEVTEITETTVRRRGHRKKAVDVAVKDMLSPIVGDSLATDFSKRVNELNNIDERQVVTALIQGFLDGSIEFEEKTIITVKSKG